MKVIRRDPTKGYLDTWLWVPKTYVDVEGTKRALTYEMVDTYSERPKLLYLWQETSGHLLLPRAFWPVATLPFTVVDCRPKSYERVEFASRIHLDFLPKVVDGVIQLRSTGRKVQQESFQAMTDSFGGVLQLACGKGKGQPLDEKVITPQGPRAIGELKVGDDVLSSSGTPVKVVGVFPQGTRPVYRVTFSDETSVRCDDQHLWQVRVDNRLWRVMGTKDLLQEGLRTRAGLRFAIQYCAPAQFNNRKLSADAWLMGAWLGDGSSSGTPKFHNPEPDLQQRFCASLSANDVGAVERFTNRCDEVRVTGGSFTSTLRKHGLYKLRSWEKFIPDEFLLAGVDDRWSLLRGLLDTDGSVTNQQRTVEYSTTSPKLAEQVAWLTRSLGGRASTRMRVTAYEYNGEKRSGRASYRVRITFPAGGAIPVSSIKHLQLWDSSPGQRTVKYITRIEREQDAETVCISVDSPDSCYLTRDFIVTHNTVIALHHIAASKVPALILLDNTNLLAQWEDDVAQFLDVPGGIGQIVAGKKDWKKALVLATYQSVANWSETMPEEVRRWFGNIYWDEGHHVSAPTYAKSAPLFYGNRYSLTATPERSDGFHIISDLHIGSVIYKDLTPEMKPKIAFYWTGLSLDLRDPRVAEKVLDTNGEVHISKLCGFFGQWVPRLQILMNLCGAAVQAGRKILILSNSVDEVVNLMALCTLPPGSMMYTDIPIPTNQEVGETLTPQDLNERELKKLEKAKLRLEAQLTKATGASMLQVQAELNFVVQSLDQYRVHKKIQSELAKRQKKYVHDLIEASERGIAGFLTYGVKAAKRQEYLDTKQLVFAITKYGKEGMDCQLLDTVVLSSLFSSKNGLQQLMGRPTRPMPGKKEPLLVALVDNVGQCIGMAKKLQSHLRSWPREEGGPYDFILVEYPAQWNKTPTSAASTMTTLFGPSSTQAP